MYLEDGVLWAADGSAGGLYSSHYSIFVGIPAFAWSQTISFGFPDQVYWEGGVVITNGSTGPTVSSPYSMFVGLTTLRLLSSKS